MSVAVRLDNNKLTILNVLKGRNSNLGLVDWENLIPIMKKLVDEALLPFYCQNTLFASLLNNFIGKSN